MPITGNDILSVFHQQDLELKFAARYGIDGKERMEVDDEPGNCISDNCNMFWFECTGFHIYWTLLT